MVTLDGLTIKEVKQLLKDTVWRRVKVSCGLPNAPRNGRVDTSAGTSFGDVASYSCDTGYTLNGPAERTCQADGRWNGSVPTCESE